MANLLRKIESIAYQPETSTMQQRLIPLKNEIIDNIEELSKEVNYLKEKVKILTSFPNDKEELSDIMFKLRDLRNSMDSRKQKWDLLMPGMDTSIKLETLKALEMLKSTTENLEMSLAETMTNF